MKRLTLILLIFGLSKVTYSQNDFRKGFIITNTKDTVFGWVNHRERIKAHKWCDFKESTDKPVITYKPNEIFGYGFIDDAYYESGLIQQIEQPAKFVFYEVLIKGKASLYRFESSFFVQKDDGALHALFYDVQETIINGKRVLQNSNRHVATLNILFFDCVELRDRISKIALTEKLLTGLVKDYNNCKGSPVITYKDKKPWITSTAGITAGINISKVEFWGDRTYEYLYGSFETSKLPTIGFSFDIFFPRFNERISLHGDIMYAPIKYHLNGVVTRSTFTARNDISIEIKQLKIPLGLRYTFPEKNVTPFVTLAAVGISQLKSSSVWREELESHNIITKSSHEAVRLKSLQLGVAAGVGVIKPISSKWNALAELRYELTNGVSQSYHGELMSRCSNFQMLLGLRKR